MTSNYARYICTSSWSDSQSGVHKGPPPKQARIHLRILQYPFFTCLRISYQQMWVLRGNPSHGSASVLNRIGLHISADWVSHRNSIKSRYYYMLAPYKDVDWDMSLKAAWWYSGLVSCQYGFLREGDLLLNNSWFLRNGGSFKRWSVVG